VCAKVDDLGQEGRWGGRPLIGRPLTIFFVVSGVSFGTPTFPPTVHECPGRNIFSDGLNARYNPDVPAQVGGGGAVFQTDDVGQGGPKSQFLLDVFDG